MSTPHRMRMPNFNFLVCIFGEYDGVCVCVWLLLFCPLIASEWLKREWMRRERVWCVRLTDWLTVWPDCISLYLYFARSPVALLYGFSRLFVLWLSSFQLKKKKQKSGNAKEETNGNQIQCMYCKLFAVDSIIRCSSCKIWFRCRLLLAVSIFIVVVAVIR